MKFKLTNTNEDPNQTFSEEALLVNMETWNTYIVRQVTTALQEGFKKGEAIKDLEVEINIKANGVEQEHDVFGGDGHYEISQNFLAQRILVKAQEQVRDTKHKTTQEEKQK